MANLNRPPLASSIREVFPQATPDGEINPEQCIEVTVRMRSRDAQQVECRSQVLHVLSHPREIGARPVSKRNYISHHQYCCHHSASDEAINAVKEFAQAYGLVVGKVFGGKRNLRLAGSIRDMRRAFDTVLQPYKVEGPHGFVYRGRTGPISIPASLIEHVEAIFGLDNRLQARVCAQLRSAPAPGAPPLCAHELKAQELADIYAFPPGPSGTLPGSGQCVGILAFTRQMSDLHLDSVRDFLKSETGIVPEIAMVNAGIGLDPREVDNSDMEFALDITTVAANAKGAKIVVYCADATEKGWVDALSTAIHDDENRPSVISISWAWREGSPFWTKAGMNVLNDLFTEAANLGITVCAASGDAGSEFDNGSVHVNFPASSEFVLACGGTQLCSHAGVRNDEIVWNDTQGASGGGVSDIIDPPNWQSGVSIVSRNPGRTGRGIPDVAGPAAPGVAITFGEGGAAATPTSQQIVGTSLASPLWASLIARINQQLPSRLGFFNPLLYTRLNATCNDVAIGNNGLDGFNGYKAAPGNWDACTGWGTPNGKKLLEALAA